MNDYALVLTLSRTRPRRHRWVVAALATVAVAVVPLAWVVLQKKPAPPGKPAVVSVSAAPVLVQEAAISITAIGAAQAWTSDIILAQVSGILRSVDFV